MAIPQRILEQFAPEVRLHPNDDYRPSSVEFYLERVVMTYGKSMQMVEPASGTGVTVENISTFSYSGNSSGDNSGSEFRLKQRDDNEVNRTMTRRGQDVLSSQGVPCYVHVNRAGQLPGVFDIQYLFFYPYNGPTSDVGDYGGHEGDWEMIIVRIKEEANGTYRLLAANYLHHGSHAWYYPEEAGWSDRILPLNAEGHPIVYSAKGSHAAYTTAGKRDGATSYSTDSTADGLTWKTWQNIKRIVDDDTGEPLDGYNWVKYGGRWGGFRARDLSDALKALGYHDVDEDGPRNPPYTSQWNTHLSLSFWRVSGSLIGVSIGGKDGAVWGVNEAGTIYRYTGNAASPWEKMPGTLRRIAVGRATRVWGSNSSDLIYRWLPGDNKWEHIDGSLNNISAADDGSVWGIGEKDAISRWNGSDWERVSGALRQIAVGSKSHIWGVNDDDEIYRYDTAGQKWIHVSGKLRQMAVDATGQEVWGLNADHVIYRWDEAGQAWTAYEGSLHTLSVGANGALWGVNEDQQIFYRV